MPALLQVEEIAHAFGGVQAVRGVSFEVPESAFYGLIGPNGAGKSTLIDCLSGALNSYSGRVTFAGRDTTRWPMHRIAQLGMIRSFQVSRMFSGLTVQSSLMVGAPAQRGEQLGSALVGSWHPQEAQIAKTADDVLRGFELDRLRDQYAGATSGGQQRLIELSRSLMARPQMLLLDEPFAGVSPANRQKLAAWLRQLNVESGLTILMVEHRLEMVEELCQSVVVMAEGRVLTEGTMAEIRANRRCGLGVPRDRGRMNLEVRGLTAGYGDQPIIFDVSVQLAEGRITAFVGPNGAGKSTLIKVVFGQARVFAGAIYLDGVEQPLTRPEVLVRNGIAYVPQLANVFPSLTVRENLELGTYVRSGYSVDKVCTLPRAWKRAGQEGGRAERRSAQHAGGGQGSHEQSRRAVAR